MFSKVKPDRYAGSDVYFEIYKRGEMDRDRLKPEEVDKNNKLREELGQIPKSRPPLEFMDINGEKVGTKNKSIFYPYKYAETEYFSSISKEEFPKPYQGHLGKM